ncbi:hypothetical protein SAMN05444161_2036 [Rhizobiales bacterium GAS191]|jgi:hypothetical protein|nr:hypothetical protein SAMN05444161_2036 [Rhizobiales bacterium GAS191]
MKRIIIVGVTAVAAILLVTGSICAQFGAGGAPTASNQIVASMAPGERDLIRRIDVADCRERVVAGQESSLDASDSQEGRSGLKQQLGLVVKFCDCKFEATSSLLTKGDVVTRWLSPETSADELLPVRGREELDGAVRDCAEKFGLRTLPVPERHRHGDW